MQSMKDLKLRDDVTDEKETVCVLQRSCLVFLEAKRVLAWHFCMGMPDLLCQVQLSTQHKTCHAREDLQEITVSLPALTPD